MFPTDIPLHPAVVHVPLALSSVLPALVLWAAWTSWRGQGTRTPWSVVAFLQLVLVASAFIAISLGQKDEERVEKVVAEEHVQAHEARGKQLAWSGLAALAISVMLIGASGPVVRLFAALAVVAALVTAGLAVRAGYSGGQLVYVYGAASAHVKSPPGAPPPGAASPADTASDAPGEADERP